MPQFWEERMKDGSYEKIYRMAGGGETYGICLDFAPDQSQFSYMIAAKVQRDVPKGLIRRSIPAATWAVFRAVGPVPFATGTLDITTYAGSVTAEELHRAILVAQSMGFARVLTEAEWEKLIEQDI